jgi:tetratricopeptide (TPR) repeat protein
MKLSIELALDQGIDAHNAGNYQEAERLYRSILQSEPTHADANHNLGNIAVAANNIESALSFFKTALEANPTIEQFYFSYIDALIKAKQIKIAKRVIKKAKKAGFAGKRLKATEVHLKKSTWGRSEKPSVGLQAPSEADINSLIMSYQNGRYDDAEKLANYITQQFPEHPLAWKILGGIYLQTDKISEALVANQKAVELDAQDSDAHNNLGSTLQQLGRLNEAVASYRQAIALETEFVLSYNNLGGRCENWAIWMSLK